MHMNPEYVPSTLCTHPLKLHVTLQLAVAQRLPGPIVLPQLKMSHRAAFQRIHIGRRELEDCTHSIDGVSNRSANVDSGCSCRQGQ